MEAPSSQQLGLTVDDSFHRCNNDGQCQQPRKCTQTAKGKYCLPPHNATSLDNMSVRNCPDGYKAVQTCLTNSNCPDGYSCYKTHCCKNHQKKSYYGNSTKPKKPVSAHLFMEKKAERKSSNVTWTATAPRKRSAATHDSENLA
ncbi:hypothetical protein D918_03543 [Trichuris suis]|nr:hypothetical protein D918_03543 [Trichuris suis]